MYIFDVKEHKNMIMCIFDEGRVVIIEKMGVNAVTRSKIVLTEFLDSYCLDNKV